MNTPTERRRYTSKDLALLPQAMHMLVHLEQALKPDMFPINSGVVDILDQIRNSSDRIIILNAELTHLVADIQKNCVHEQYNITEHDPNYRWGGTRGDFVLAEKICHKCRQVITRPKGTPFKICHKCWGPMKYEGCEPGQGERFHHYECTLCHHHVEHT